ncbi:MAG: UDP-4-amino-4,6-dideoxy-N-acetyl-beta-L-altrosamine transaminase [Salinisphaeraceae bacterium]|nr:UDP-4-amino-4,6-dideoxy-N-acetyl-beta-L-altrosamine transaminase [Salinisphaeraceae bacterium]
MIPYGRQDVTQADIDAVVSVLRSDYLTQGPVVPRFEEAVASYCGAAGAVAVCNATAALHLVYRALGLGPGDLLWTSPITFVATANAALYCGADVDFVDIDPATYNLCSTKLAEKLERAQAANRLPKIVTAVHLAGQSCDMVSLAELAHQYGFRLVEDASHAIGGRYKNRPIGSCDYSDAAVFSFHPVKIITSGEGGMVTSKHKDLVEKVELLRSHGITRDPSRMTRSPDGPWYYQQIELGFNYRMTELQAALGLSQFGRLDDYVRRRHEIASVYNSALKEFSLLLPAQHHNSYSAFHLYIIRLKNAIEQQHRKIFEGLRAADIGVNLHYIPVHKQPYYEGFGRYSEASLPESERYYRQAISLPIFPSISTDQQETVIETLKALLTT